MTIEKLGSKLYSGTKVDRVSPSLGSDADGTNNGITLFDNYVRCKVYNSSGVEQTEFTSAKLRSDIGTSAFENVTMTGSHTVAQGDRIVMETNGGDSSNKILFLRNNSNGNDNPSNTSYVRYESGSFSTQSKSITGSMIFNGSTVNLSSSTDEADSYPTSNEKFGLQIDASASQIGQTLTSVTFKLKRVGNNPAKLGTGAYEFDGSSSVVTTDQRVNGLHDGTGGSITFWVKKNSHADNDIIYATHNASGSGAGIEVKFNSSGNIKSTTTNSSSGWVDTTSTTALANDTWYHVAVTLDTDTKYRIYINGTLETTGSAFTPRTGNSSQAYTIGDNPSSGGYFDGVLDDMSIWSRALTATEISDLVNTTLPSTATDSFNFSSSTGWSTSGQSDSEVDTSAGNLKYKGIGDSNDHRVSYDLTSVSDKQWKVRFVWNPTTTASSDGCGGSYYFYGLSDSTGAKTTSQDFIGIGMIGGDNLILTRSNGQSLQDGALGGGDLITGFSTGTTYYVTIERTSNDTITATVRTGSHTGTVAGTSRTYTDSSVEGITGLRYFKGCGYGSGSNVCGTTNQNIGTIDDLEIFNASDDGALVSSLSDKSNLKAYYSMDSTSLGATKTFSDDFTSDNWTDTDDKIAVNTSNERLEFDARRDSSDDKTVYDLQTNLGSGTNASETAWLLRYELTWSTIGSGDTNYLFVGLSDSAVAHNSNADRITTQYRAKDSTHNTVYASDSDGGSLGGSTGDNNAQLNYSTGTTYYVTMRRTSATAYDISIKTGSHSGTEVVSLSGTVASTVDNLRYIVVQNLVSSGSATATGYIDNMEFYNGVSALEGCKNDFSATSDLEALSGVRTNSLFQQVDDTPKYYWYDGTSWVIDAHSAIATWSTANTSAIFANGATYSGNYSKQNGTMEWNGTAWSNGSNTNEASYFCGGVGNRSGAMVIGGTTADAGANSADNVSEKWDGSSWTSTNALNSSTTGSPMGGTISSGYSATIWGGGGASPTSATQSWDGTSWSASTNCATASRFGNGDGNSNTNFFLVGGTDSATDRSEIWNGSSWSAGVTFDGTGTQTGKGSAGAGSGSTNFIGFNDERTGSNFGYTFNGTAWTLIAQPSQQNGDSICVGGDSNKAITASSWNTSSSTYTNYSEYWNGTTWSTNGNLTANKAAGGMGASA